MRANETHIMLDLETLGTKPGCQILSLGACSMFNAPGVLLTCSFKLDTLDQEPYDLKAEEETLKWWRTQGEDAISKSFSGRTRLLDALLRFENYLYAVATVRGTDPAEVYIWAKSPSFDCSILGFAYTKLGRKVPWKFRNERDVRTLLSLVPDQCLEFKGTPHVALEDALHQKKEVELAVESLVGGLML